MNIIVLHDMRYGIARRGDQPLHITADLQRFRRLTTGHTVVMGRKTAQVLRKPLKDRTNVVLSRNPDLILPKGFIRVSFLEPNDYTDDDFIIGGANVYNQALESDVVDTIYGTMIFYDFECDQFINVNREPKWMTVEMSSPKLYVDPDGNEYSYVFYTQKKVKPC